MKQQLIEALQHPLWKQHKPGKKYHCKNSGTKGKVWEIWYYPIFECGKTKQKYDEPRALVGMPKVFNGEQGLDLREMPLRYLYE